MRRWTAATISAKSSAQLPDPDRAWKVLALVNEWVRHAEAKLGVALAATGVSGGVLFNVVDDPSHASIAFYIAATLCGAALGAAGLCAMVGLYPVVRLRRRAASDSVNPLYFHDIARIYSNDSTSYCTELRELTVDSGELVRHVGQQVHANAIVAVRKYRWADRAIRLLLLGLIALSALVTLVAIG